MDAKLLIGVLETNYGVLQRQIHGLTHEDSLLQPPFRGNCLNWVLGHIVNGRNQMLTITGEAGIWSDAESAPYRTDSDPIKDVAQARHFDRIVADLKTCHERLQIAIARLSAADLAKLTDEQATMGSRLHGLLWHETYHVGQTEYLRQLTGVNDKVI